MTYRESLGLIGGLMFVLGCCIGPMYPALGFTLIGAFFIMGACLRFEKSNVTK